MGLLDYMEDNQPAKKMTPEEEQEDAAFWKKERELSEAAKIAEVGPPVDKELMKKLVLKEISDEQARRVFLLIAGFQNWKDAYLEELMIACKAPQN